MKLRLLDSKTLKPQPANPHHQADADRRDQAFDNQSIDPSISQELTDWSPSVNIINKPQVAQILKRGPRPTPSTRSSEY